MVQISLSTEVTRKIFLNHNKNETEQQERILFHKDGNLIGFIDVDEIASVHIVQELSHTETIEIILKNGTGYEIKRASEEGINKVMKTLFGEEWIDDTQN